MKKRIVALLALGVTCAVAIAGCTIGQKKGGSADPATSEETGDDLVEIPASQEDVEVCYYGCPRSKRLRALKTGKREV